MIKLKLYFENSFGERKLVENLEVEDDNINTLLQITNEPIKNFIKERNSNFVIYYTRCWGSIYGESGMCFDVGSHTEFFYLIAADLDTESLSETASALLTKH